MKLKLLFIAITENISIRGVERYCLEFLKSLAKEHGESLAISVLAGEWQRYYSELTKYNIKLIYADVTNNKIHRHLYLTTKIYNLSKSFDIVHYGNTLPCLIKNTCPSIFTIHDIAEYFVPEKYSSLQLLYRKMIVKNAVHLSDKIITVSAFSKDAIVKKFNVPESKIIVTFNGIDHFENRQDIAMPFVGKPYFFYFGVIERSKGVIELIKAFRIFKEQSKLDYCLIIAGKKGNAYADIERLISDDIIVLDYVPDIELYGYISAAKAVVFPSKYEGFGFPALEGFVYNDNVVTSNTTALAEISSDFALQVNPESEVEIAEAMCEVVNKPRRYDDMQKKQILNKFKWQTAANELFIIYNSL